jgi:glycosyltransferase involved in cell wall biosynthesis
LKKKLVYILNQYSEKEGSHFFHILNLLEEIASNGVEIILIIEKSKSKPKFVSKNIQVILQKRTGISRFFELFKIILSLYNQGYRKVFIRISTWGAIPAILLSVVTKIETYFWQSGTTHLTEKSKKFNFSRFIKSQLPFYFVKKFTSYFVTGPEIMVKYYIDVVNVKPKKIICLYNDIDISRFKNLSQEEKHQLKAEMGFDNNTNILLHVKRMSTIKGILFYNPYVLEKSIKFLRANNYKCIYIGDGSEKDKLKKIIKDKHLEDIVKVLGSKPNSEIQKYYQITDVFINPTLEEGFPRVLLEAMASGLPTVTTNAGGTANIVGELQSKYMVDTKDKDGFANNLREILENEKLQYKLGQENLISAKRFSTKNVAKMYIENIFKND